MHFNNDRRCANVARPTQRLLDRGGLAAAWPGVIAICHEPIAVASDTDRRARLARENENLRAHGSPSLLIASSAQPSGPLALPRKSRAAPLITGPSLWAPRCRASVRWRARARAAADRVEWSG